MSSSAPRKKIKLGIVGIGHLGSRHLKICHELSDKIEIVGICDQNLERTKRLANHYGLPLFPSHQELIDKVDAVNICTPTSTHFAIARDFLNNGIHTFIEKPITTTVAEAEELTSLADKKGLKLQVGHVERFNAACESVKRFAKRPLFIECHRLNPFPNRSLDIGVVMDLMIHDIDIILGLVPEEIMDIQAIGVKVLTPMEDIANARITFKNGCVCNLTASRVSPETMRKIRIFLYSTYISLDYVNQEAFVYKKCDAQILKHALPIEKEQPLKKEIISFIDCINKDLKPLVSGSEATRALRLALAITEKICQNPLYHI